MRSYNVFKMANMCWLQFPQFEQFTMKFFCGFPQVKHCKHLRYWEVKQLPHDMSCEKATLQVHRKLFYLRLLYCLYKCARALWCIDRTRNTALKELYILFGSLDPDLCIRPISRSDTNLVEIYAEQQKL